MKCNVDVVLGYIAKSEGGYVSHPKDPGGATNFGVTQRTYNAYRLNIGESTRSVKEITKIEVRDIFETQYFKNVKFDELPSGLDYAVVDFAIHSGPARAIKTLQKIVGVNPDGVLGAVTLAAIKNHEVIELIQNYCAERMRFLKTLKTFDTFGRGWTVRVLGSSQQNDAGVIGRSLALVNNFEKKCGNVTEIPAKAETADISKKTIANSVARDPVAVIPVVGGVLATLADGNGPVQYAVGISIIVFVIFAVYVKIRRDKRND